MKRIVTTFLLILFVAQMQPYQASQEVFDGRVRTFLTPSATEGRYYGSSFKKMGFRQYVIFFMFTFEIEESGVPQSPYLCLPTSLLISVYGGNRVSELSVSLDMLGYTLPKQQNQDHEWLKLSNVAVTSSYPHAASFAYPIADEFQPMIEYQVTLAGRMLLDESSEFYMTLFLDKAVIVDLIEQGAVVYTGQEYLRGGERNGLSRTKYIELGLIEYAQPGTYYPYIDMLTVDWASGAYGTVVGTGIGRTVVVE